VTRQHASAPQLPVPVLRTTNLARTSAWYREVLGLRMVQRVPHVCALLRLGAAEFHLWQVPEVEAAQTCCIVLDGRRTSVFECHAQLARTARGWIAAAPALQPWGAWEFSVTDCDGNRLRWMQWATCPLPAPAAIARAGRRDWNQG
jgi:catechol 2,3-dioxygenase-like lactoylglutathione lyase family enzyme